MRRADILLRGTDKIYEACIVTTTGVRTMGRKARDVPWAEIERIRYWRTTRGRWAEPPTERAA